MIYQISYFDGYWWEIAIYFCGKPQFSLSLFEHNFTGIIFFSEVSK